MELYGITSVTTITVICYLAAMLIKAAGIPGKWLPVICGILGGTLGLLALIFIRDFPAGDFLSAVAVGITSGLAATGADQIIKNFSEEA